MAEMTVPLELPMGAGQAPRGGRARPVRMAEIVASALRSEILRGEITVLPRLEALAERFDAGPTAVREAMRILETEGLITMRRGNVGGAEVHRPNAARVAYMVGLVLESEAVDLSDVGAALRELEPLCAVMCAARADRHETVVPNLRRLVAAQAAALDDFRVTRRITDEFHHTIVDGCGNATMVLTIGALGRVWAAHAKSVYDTDRVDVEPPKPTIMKASLREHELLLAAIDKGDPKVATLALRHLQATHAYMAAVEGHMPVSASAMD